NGDGRDDVVVSYPRTRRLYLLLGDATEGLAHGGGLDGPDGPTVVADVDGDGDPDIIAGGVALLRNDHGSFVRDAGALVTSLQPETANVGDIDGDGAPELLITTARAAELFANRGGV